MKRILACIVALACLVSCDYELCYEHPHTGELRVVFDWREAPDAAPESMSLYLFPAAGGEPLRYEFAGCAGGVVTVPEGSYRALCLNSDTERVLCRDTELWERFECSTRTTELLAGYDAYGVRAESVPRAEGTADERIAATPDELWSDRAEQVAVAKGDTRTLTLYPSTAVCTYTVEICGAENLKYAAALGGSLSGMAGGFLAGRGTTTAERVTVPFDASKSEDRTTLHARFLTFGQPAGSAASHMLIVYAVLSDNTKWYYTYDVTEQVRRAPDPYRVHILLEGLPLPKPIQNGNGFRPDVDEWQTVKIDIAL